ncbi:unnamed protein product [Caenorhabditis bovis]|uniref:Uncharacterized protein n=1 Tax=Caenorhabditis bovis TaxID=2654633 RepID=A0A8S1EDN2_9PELO|nr:unnamed protein product [Caenorhabditis bovis]
MSVTQDAKMMDADVHVDDNIFRRSVIVRWKSATDVNEIMRTFFDHGFGVNNLDNLKTSISDDDSNFLFVEFDNESTSQFLGSSDSKVGGNSFRVSQEIEAYGKGKVIRAFYAILSLNEEVRRRFRVFHIANSRTPLLVLESKILEGLKFDISINNAAAVNKALLISQWIESDKSKVMGFTVQNIHNITPTPIVVLDPSDVTHNIAAQVTINGLRRFNVLIRNGLLILKQKDLRINALLSTHLHALNILRQKAALSNPDQNKFTVVLPDVVQTPRDIFVLMSKILSFHLSEEDFESTNFERPFTLITYGKSWIGRRGTKFRLKQNHQYPSNLHLELAVSRSLQPNYGNDPVAVIVVCLKEIDETKLVEIEVIEGSVVDMRNAMHFLFDQFITNNLEDLRTVGISALNGL